MPVCGVSSVQRFSTTLQPQILPPHGKAINENQEQQERCFKSLATPWAIDPCRLKFDKQNHGGFSSYVNFISILAPGSFSSKLSTGAK